MDEVVCISSEDEMKVEDIVEVFEEVSWYFVANSYSRVDSLVAWIALIF